MKIELSMSSDQLLLRGVALLQEQGLNARVGASSVGCPHRLVVADVQAAQEGLVRGLALSLDPDAARVEPPTMG